MKKASQEVFSNEHHDKQVMSFFPSKKNIPELIKTWKENKGWKTKEELKSFLYNEEQENTEGIIMEVNTTTVGGPGIIEYIDGADTAYMKAYPDTEYTKLIQEIKENLSYVNEEKYFEKYVLSELADKQAEKIVLLFGRKRKDIPVENIGLKDEYAERVPLYKFRKLLKEKKRDIAKTLLMNYGFSQRYKSEQNHEAFKKIFGDRYVNEENFIFSSKQWPTLLGWKELTGPYTSNEEIEKKINKDKGMDESLIKKLESSYIVKEGFKDQGYGIYFPGQWKFGEGSIIQGTKNGKEKKIEYYALQKFYELPRKISIEKTGVIQPKTVDIRAFLMVKADTGTIDVQLFGREGNIGEVNNVSSGGNFTKVYVVSDESYYDIQEKIHELMMQTDEKEQRKIKSFFDSYAKDNFKITPQAKISHVPFIMSATGCNRIVKLVNDLIKKMTEVGFIAKNKDGWTIGNTVIGIDIAVNPLPKET